MSCKPNKSLKKSDNCGYVVGGLAKVYYVAKDDIASWTAGTDGGYSAVVMSTSGGVAKWYEAEITQDSSFYNQTFVPTSPGQGHLQHLVDMTVASFTQESFDVFDTLMLSQLVVIAETRTGDRFVIGYQGGLYATTGEIVSGTAATDNQTIHVVLAGPQVEGIKTFTGTIPV